MESILARALEYTLKYWLKSFSRDQFKLQGRTVQLSNLDINGDALHSSVGLPPALHVTVAKVGKLTLTLPSVSNVQVEPIVVQIDRLDLVLEENPDAEASRTTCSTPSSAVSGWSSGYGFADKIADGMTLEVTTVNLLLETRGGGKRQGGAAWASPLASVTIHNLLLYTTNENWQVVNLKEAREFFSNSKYIYVFKKLEWESLSIDLLPHPDMFSEANLARAQGADQIDDDGAKRVFFGGERFIEGISGEAYITVKRTELNTPLGLEVQLHITEAVCPALSEPGLRALLRFLTGLYICLNRGDVDLKAQERSVEAAGHSLVSIVVDHIFLCIKDAGFQLELLMQSLHFSRASVSDGESANNLTRLMVGGLFLRDTFSHPPCTLVQPSMLTVAKDIEDIPNFAKNFCPPIYPLGEQQWQRSVGVPLICFYSLQVNPSPAPPFFASETVINCQPLMIFLQEDSCLRICSFLADGIIVSPGAVLPDSSIKSLLFMLKELELTFPLKFGNHLTSEKRKDIVQKSLTGAKLRIENLILSESPCLKMQLLNLEKDPACFCLWDDQPIDASQKKWTTKASLVSLSLEACAAVVDAPQSRNNISDLWPCVEVKDARFEAAMATSDGKPLTDVPPPGGIVRVGVACQQYLSNTSVEQLFFVLDLYTYIGRISEKIALVGRNSRARKVRTEAVSRQLLDKVPSDTAVSLAVKDLQLKFLESSSFVMEDMPLVQFIGDNIFIKVTHRTLGGAIAVSSTLRWESIQVDCVDTPMNLGDEDSLVLSTEDNGNLVVGSETPKLRAVLWINNKSKYQLYGHVNPVPFLEISTVQVIPFHEDDIECHSLNVLARISGIRLGGGMNYAESLLHRFGILGPDGGPGEGLLKGLDNLSSGPLPKLFKASPLNAADLEKGDGKDNGFLHSAKPDNFDMSVELNDWLFALEGPQEMGESWQFNLTDVGREERSWHTSFKSLRIEAKSECKNGISCKERSNPARKFPLELVIIDIEGLQTLKPQYQGEILVAGVHSNGIKETFQMNEGINLEVRMVISEDDVDSEMAKWMVENLRFSIKKPIEAVVSRDELQHLAFLCKSEIDSMGRITAGVLRMLKLEDSVGQAAIDQLSNLGSQGLERILTPDKLSRGSSAASISLASPNYTTNETHSIPSTVASLEETVLESQAKCTALLTALGNSGASTQHVADVEQLTQNLQHIQRLLKQLRTNI
ncbi:Chorein_N domain-containing protein [Psidium guajava]|nr:Chorein_N domain-containing protein [Psidium guajava]